MSLDESPRHWPPLGMPIGSVRAILTLFVVAVVVANVAQDRKLDLIWTETLLIALAHYFTARRFVSLAPDVLKRLQNEGVLEKDANPLWLPRHTVRLIVLGTFGLLAYYLYRENRLATTQAVSMLGIVAAYATGSAMKTVTSWIGTKTNRQPSSGWGDLKAIVVLLAVAIAGVPELAGGQDFMPESAHRIALGLMLFYFGSR